MRRDNERRGGNFFLTLVRGSIILGLLDRLMEWIYLKLKTGFFGFVFTGYPKRARFALGEWLSGTRLAALAEKLRRWLCRGVEESFFIRLVRTAATLLLGCRLRVYGTFTVSFGAYTAAIAVIRNLLEGGVTGTTVLLNTTVITAIVLLFAGLPLIFSKKSLSEALCSSLVGGVIRSFTGFTEEDMTVRTGGGHMSTGFLLGLLCGVLTYKVSPILLIGAIAAVVGAYLVLVKPEIGVLALFFFMPILPTMVLLGLEMYTFLCYAVKLFRKKRVFRMEPVDVVCLAFAFVLMTGGFISVSSASLKQALLLVGFLLSYFLVVGLIRSMEWLTRCSVAAVLSGTLISLYGLATYFLGMAPQDDAWLDSELFGAITGRAYATLENPNMYGEYLVLIIPIAFGMLIRRFGGMRKDRTLFCLCVLFAGLVCSFSRGAMLGLVLAMVVFLLIWHRRAVLLLIGGAVALPFLPMILPESISSRFLNLFNMADSSTSYRVGGWVASLEMLKDNILAGIGVGTDAWGKIYPQYSLNAMESTPHAHNLFLQLVIDLGIMGLVAYLLFLFLLYQSGFTYFAELSDERLLLPEALGDGDAPKSTEVNQNIRRSRMDLRIQAAAPLCSVLAVLAHGMVENIWYNYRVYLMIWLVTGLASAYIRTGTSLIAACRSGDGAGESGAACSVDLERAECPRKHKSQEKRAAAPKKNHTAESGK